MKSNTNRCGVAPRPGKTMPLTSLFSSTPAILRVLFAGLFALWSIGASAATRYVRAGGSGNGSSWANASGNLQAMINASATGDQVWVATGTYKPTTGTDRDISFEMKNGVEILGGFPATGNPGLAERDWVDNPTILSGDIGTVGNDSDNSYNVIFNYKNGLTNSAVLDGFTVTGGKGTSGYPESCGGGMFNRESSPTIKNCTFSDNKTSGFGGGMYNEESSPTVTNCIFERNDAASGGGIYNNFSSAPVVTNCVFRDNDLTGSNTFGGGMANYGSSPTLRNCTMSGNSTIHAGGMYNYGGSNPDVINSIFWGNSSEIYDAPNFGANVTTVIYSIVQGGFAGTGNLDTDPLFADAAGGDFRLLACSPGIDAGNDADNFVSEDLDGNPREFEAIPGGQMIDMGAYEYQTAVFSGVWHVNAAAATPGSGVSWDCPMQDLQQALAVASSGDQIWVAAGTYKPTAGTDRSISFVMKNGVEILGGFPATGNPGLAERDWADNPTILSGDLLGNDGANFANYSDNSYHVVRSDGVANTAHLDGFTIQSGCANRLNSTTDKRGGGLLNNSSSPVVSNCAFMYNYAENLGGGIYNENASPELSNCIFISNKGESGGGGLGEDEGSVSSLSQCQFLSNIANSGGAVYSNGNSRNFTDCIFKGNYVARLGGAIYANHNQFSMTNCLMSGNWSGVTGGALYFAGTPAVLTNCTIVANTTPDNGGVIFGANNVITLHNCIVWGNNTAMHLVNGSSPAIDHTIIQGGYAGIGNLNTDPLFEDQPNHTDAPTTQGDLRPQACSPAIDGGLDANNSTTTALDGNARKFEAIPAGEMIDMGAFEYQQTVPLPVAVCQTFTANLVSNSVIVSAADIDNGSEDDACGPVTLSINGQPSVTFSCSDIGNHTVTLTVYAAQSNRSASCQTTVTVQDDTPPMATCADLTISLDDLDNASIEPADVFGSGTDNCGTVSPQNVTPDGFNCQNLGNNIVTLTVNDGNGNTNTCTAAVTVQDDTPPTATCEDITISLDGNGNASIEPEDVFGGGTDACGTASPQNVTPDDFNCQNLGANIVTLTVSDGNGNTNTCTAAVTVQDVTPPSVSCADLTISLDGSGATIEPEDVFDSGTDACGTVSPQNVTPDDFNCQNLGNNIVTLMVSDGNGNTNTCTATVTVQDDTPPSVTCADITVSLDGGGNASIEPEDIFDSGTDACGTVSPQSVTPDGFNCQNLGNNIVTLMVSDGNGNTNTCTATVTVQDNTLPAITCPNPVTVTCASQVPAVNLNTVTTSDNCGAPTKSHVNDATTNQTCANRKTVTRTYRATDGSGNSRTCSQVITVFDDVKPNFSSVPANVTVQCNSVPAVGNATATDGCGGTVTVSYNGQTVSNILCTDKYTLIRQWTAADLCGNTKTATQRITVTDTQKPTFTSVPANVTVQCSAVPTPGSAAATDNCDPTVDIAYNGETRTNGACADSYILTRQWTATDNCGNTRTATQRITVQDTQKPTFTAVPAGITLECTDPIPDPGAVAATDNCDASLTITYVGQSATYTNCPNTYTLTRTWKATDNCGNWATATQTITVQDTQAPAFTSVPAHITIECSDLVPPIGQATATDNCGGYVHVAFLGNSSAAGDCPWEYVLTRSWRATDECGYSVTATQTITVWDTQAPVFNNAPANITLACGAALPGLPAVTATDLCDNQSTVTYLGEENDGPDCPYTVTRTWETADDCGNVRTHTQVIAVGGQSLELEVQSLKFEVQSLELEVQSLKFEVQSLKFEDAEPMSEPRTSNFELQTSNFKPRTSNFELQTSNFKLFPNPTTDRIWLDLTDFAGEAVTITIHSDLGRLVWERRSPALEEMNLSVSLREAGAAAGIYTVSVRSAGGVAARRVVLVE